jgi:hypothetical protein
MDKDHLDGQNKLSGKPADQQTHPPFNKTGQSFKTRESAGATSNKGNTRLP